MDDTLVKLNREHIQRVMSEVQGNKKQAAAALGISRRALYRRLERYGLSDTITRRRTPRPTHETTTKSESEPASTDS